MSSLKQQAISGVIWTFAQQFSVQIINFVVQIVLARLLMPEMFGLIAMLAVFISIGYTLMEGGMTSSLIRTKNPDQLDYSTVFITNFMVSAIVYAFTFIAAPFIADFYNQEILKDILRVYALTFVMRALVAVHLAKLTKEMNFKAQMKLEIPASISAALVGISMAYTGYGVWSLVGLNMTHAVVFTIQSWLFIKWRPTIAFNKRRFKYHFNFGYKMTLAALLDTVYRNIYSIVIGKSFAPAQVGFFSQAETMRLFPVNQLSTVMNKVTYPLFSNIKGDEQLKAAYKATMKLMFFVVVPMMMLLIVGAREFFLFLFGEKWLLSVPYFQVLAFASIVMPLSTYNLNILKVKGRSDLLLRLEVIKKSIGFIAVFAAVPFGIMPLVISYLVISYLFSFINMIVCGKLIDYSFWEQVKDCGKIYSIGIASMVVTYYFRIYLIQSLDSSFMILLCIGSVFALIYLLSIYLLEKETITLLTKVIKK